MGHPESSNSIAAEDSQAAASTEVLTLGQMEAESKYNELLSSAFKELHGRSVYVSDTGDYGVYGSPDAAKQGAVKQNISEDRFVIREVMKPYLR